MWINLDSTVFSVFLLLYSLPTTVPYTCVNKDYFTAPLPTQPSTLACQRKMFDYKDLGKLLSSPQVHSQTVESRAGELCMAVMMQNGQRAALGALGSWAVLLFQSENFEQHPLESLFLCRIISSIFWTLCCGSKQPPLLFSHGSAVVSLCIGVLEPTKVVFAPFSPLPLQLKSTAWLWAACALDCWARGKTGFETANPKRVPVLFSLNPCKY